MFVAAALITESAMAVEVNGINDATQIKMRLSHNCSIRSHLSHVVCSVLG